MPLRPASARWFELLIAREQLEPALRALASTGVVELQAHGAGSAAHLLPQLSAALGSYQRLAERYRPYWPAPASRAHPERELEAVPREALAHLTAWAAASDPLVARLQQGDSAQATLTELATLLSAGPALPDLALLDQAGPALSGRIYRMDPDRSLAELPGTVLTLEVTVAEQPYLLALGESQEIAAVDERLTAHRARRLQRPPGLPAQREACLAEIAARQEALAAQTGEIRAQLAELNRVHDVAGALGDLRFGEWLLEHVPEMAVTEHFGWITGWTSAPSQERIEAALAGAGVPNVLRFPPVPAGLSRPVVLRNPIWARPFELFERLLGIPAASEADPSMILALLVPVMFGFMFGDVGQGALLVLAGLLLRRRYPAVWMLVPCGLSAMFFGALFGSVFTREDLLPALWLHPLARPLLPLLVSLVFGAGVLTMGLLLDALQHHWAGEALLWWRTRAGLLVAYLGMLGCALSLRALWAVGAGLVWFWLGSSLGPADRIARLGGAIAESIETVLQLFVNTLSFVRIGAFALAHAGLAGAIHALAAGVSSRLAAFIVLTMGNVAVVVVEGLIVGIQTTRLVLFEFFIRFLHGAGRAFRPLPPPQLPVQSGR
jgi:V/A-type H+-transporting ATPase subunit I